ncbi:hypothetical protein FRB99_008232, partial [Tulasnella sp. 403]
MVALALERSQGADLDVSYPPVDIGQTPEYLAQISAHASRWRTLHINSDNTHEITKCLGFPAPGIQTVNVTYEQPGQPVVVGKGLFAGECPLLQHVHLLFCTLRWKEVKLQNLVTLTLMGLYPGPSSMQLLDILRQSPNIREIEMDDCRMKTGPDEVLDPKRFALPDLKVLIMTDVSGGALRQVLSHLDLPPGMKQFHISVHSPEDSPSMEGITQRCAEYWVQQDHKPCRLSIYNSNDTEPSASQSFDIELNDAVLSDIFEQHLLFFPPEIRQGVSHVDITPKLPPDLVDGMVEAAVEHLPGLIGIHRRRQLGFVTDGGDGGDDGGMSDESEGDDPDGGDDSS